MRTLSSIGTYETPSPLAIGDAIARATGAMTQVKAAWDRIETRANAAPAALPEVRTLVADLPAARANNEVNIATARAAYDAALVFCLTRDQRYAIAAAARLRAFREQFLPARELPGIGAGHQDHLLYARDWLPYLASTFDVIYDALPQRERTAEAQWLKAMTAWLARPEVWEQWKDTAHGAWQVAALGCVGAALDNQQLLALAWNRAAYQMQTLLGPEGLWPGGSLALHYSATRALLAYAEATRLTGNNAYQWRTSRGEACLRRMVEAPLMFLDPSGEIPGDDRLASRPPPPDTCLVAGLRYADAALSAAAVARLDDIPDEQVLRYCVPGAQPGRLAPRPGYSVYSPTMGWAVLRTAAAQRGTELYARLDFGPQGGSDGHADKLALYISGRGRRVTSDTDPYSADSPLQSGWARHTLAHNTVVINYQSQLGARTPADASGVPGRLLLFDRAPAISLVEAEARAAYPQAPLNTYRRCVAMTDRYLLDIFTIGAVQPVVADWAFHGLGRHVAISNTIPGERSLNNEMVRSQMLGSVSEGYNWIDDVTIYTANEQWNATWDNGLRTIMMGQPATHLLLGRSGGIAEMSGTVVVDRKYSQNTLIARRANVLETRFVAVHEIVTSNMPVITSFARLETGVDALVLEITMRDCKDIFVLQQGLDPHEMMVDQDHVIEMAPQRYAFMRFGRLSGRVIEQVNATVKPPR